MGGCGVGGEWCRQARALCQRRDTDLSVSSHADVYDPDNFSSH